MTERFDKTFFDTFIKDSNKYYAHIPPDGDNRKPELLSEHSALTMVYATTISEVNRLQPIIEGLTKQCSPQSFSRSFNSEIECLFWRTIAFHDLGKLNEKFQIIRMKNRQQFKNVNHSFSSNHALISVYLYLAVFFSELIKMNLSDEEQVYLCNIALYLSYPIYMHHHSKLYDCQNEDNWDRKDLWELKPYISLLNVDMDDEQIELFHIFFLGNANFDVLFTSFNEISAQADNGFPLYVLVKLCYSILTAADYIATAHYMNNWKTIKTDAGTIDNGLRNKIIENAHNSKYNKEIFDFINGKDNVLNNGNLKSCNKQNLNILRRNLAVEILTGVRKNYNKRLFYIEAPTGSGKTNISMLAVAEVLAYDKSINKVFYVFPFTTLITQTYMSLKTTLGLNDDEVVQVHSKAPLYDKHDDGDDDEMQYINYIDNLFLNYPVALLSHVRFFDVLKTNGKDANYLLHRMANSIVIIDELQSYSPAIWDKIVYFLSSYADNFNMRFILMSATLPKIGKLIDNKNHKDPFVYLVTDKAKYFQNPNFCNRVLFDYSLLQWNQPEKDDKEDYLIKLFNKVQSESKTYAKSNDVYNKSVHTIIEFITKRTASEFLSIANKNNTLFDSILILSGTILGPRKREIIQLLNNTQTRDKKILLITTQVVEAGVDIDMDLGFKDKSIIDSEEQLAGRINRNALKRGCKMFLFDCDFEKLLYGNDERYREENHMSLDEYKDLLIRKDFDSLYNSIIQQIKRLNHSSYIVNMDSLYKAIKTLDYRSVNESLKIISQKNLTVFVPLQLSRQQLGDMYKIAESMNLNDGEVVSGKAVWNKYISVIERQNENFMKNRLLMKRIMSLMSAFTFSIFPRGKDIETIKTYGKMEYGFFYLENYDDVYSYENGINTSVLQYSNFW